MQNFHLGTWPRAATKLALDPAGRRAVEVRAVAGQIGAAVLVQGAAAGENRRCCLGFEGDETWGF